MERYSSYKESGVYFIPQIPQGWDMKRAKFLFNEEKRAVRPEDEIVTCFRDGQVTLRKNRRTEGFTTSLKEFGYQGVRKGDLVIHNMDAFAGSIGVSNSDGKGTPVYSCCTPLSDNVNQYYYCYLLRSLARDGFILSLAKGIRERSTDFRFNDFKELYLPLPSRKEQDKMVEFVDRATAQLDAAIAREQQMIDLLNERKRIIIQQAVTKGLDPSAKLKPPGVEWLGDIPESWEIRRMRYLCKITTGNKDTINREDDGAYPFYVRSPKIERINTYSFDGEAVLMAGDGVGAGKVLHYANGKFDFHQRVYCFFDYTDVKTKFAYFYLLANFRHKIDEKGAKSTVDSVRLPWLKDFPICIPPMEEQEKIISFLDSSIKELDNAISLIESKIALLQERKQILISEVVTGKIKVS